jgi:DNA-directed RNA polymerase specialized sigma subunit
MKDPKIFLKRYIWTNREIDRKLEEIGRLRERVKRISVVPENSRVQVAPHDHVGDMIAKIVDMESALDKDIDKLLSIKAEIEAAISAVDDERLQLLLRYRYIDDLVWEQIALNMDFCYVHVVHRLHPIALNKIKDVIECNT